MGGLANKAFRAIMSFWFFSTTFILTAFVFAIFIYRLKFSGGLSANSGDWSNFGGYIGGIFGPLVSFVTLLAVLKTVYLQRELLVTQREEFSSMQALQRETFNSQQDQIKWAAETAKQDQHSRALDHLLSMVDRHCVLYENMVSRATQGVQAMANWAFEGRPIKEEHMVRLSEKNKRHKITLESLACLSIDLSMMKFNSIDEMREFYRSEMHKILEAESNSSKNEAVTEST
jgi:hypothetical protein